MQADPDDLEPIANLLLQRIHPGQTLVVGVTGSVAVGKSTLCEALKVRLSPLRVETTTTDGFLFPNAVLAERGLTMRKGFPETYDIEALIAAISGVRRGPVAFPGYSHIAYDIDPALSRPIDRPDILLLDGLGLSPRFGYPDVAEALDLLVYLDAEEVDLENWFVERFIGLWRAAEHDPTSFYSRFRSMTETETAAFARRVWTEINLPNLRDHIFPAREIADIVVRKSAGHRLHVTRTQRRDHRG